MSVEFARETWANHAWRLARLRAACPPGLPVRAASSSRTVRTGLPSINLTLPDISSSGVFEKLPDRFETLPRWRQGRFEVHLFITDRMGQRQAAGVQGDPLRKR